jgi:hypothetical protein
MNITVASLALPVSVSPMKETSDRFTASGELERRSMTADRYPPGGVNWAQL